MNDKYEFTETFYNKCQHDMREFRKRIDQLEKENERKQMKLDEIERLCEERKALLIPYDVTDIEDDILEILRGENE